MTGTETKEGLGRASPGPSREPRDGEATGKDRIATSRPRGENDGNTGIRVFYGLPGGRPRRAEERRRYTKETVWQNLKVFRLTLKRVDGQEI